MCCCLIVLVSNAEAERVFSCQNRIKTKTRTLLGIEQLDRIPMSEFDFPAAREMYLQAPRRLQQPGLPPPSPYSESSAGLGQMQSLGLQQPIPDSITTPLPTTPPNAAAAAAIAAAMTGRGGRQRRVAAAHATITKKLAGDVENSASWMTNVANEKGLVLNSVLTTGEGPAMLDLCQAIVKRYKEANEPAPEALYVDQDEGNHAILTVDNIIKLWKDFEKLALGMKAEPVATGQLTPGMFQRKVREWGKLFRRVTFDEHVTLYIHATVYHVPQFLKKYNYIMGQKLLPDVISTPDSLPDSLPVGMVTPN
ncbi:hypothetical protein Bbelb_050340 [Branchiostoma belcheri]|nr:hypothetical protein Bbelb_050340 [Branchiostoma belcheri]